MKTLKNIIQAPFIMVAILVGIAWLLIACMCIDENNLDNKGGVK